MVGQLSFVTALFPLLSTGAIIKQILRFQHVAMETLRETNKINIQRKVSSVGTLDSMNQSVRVKRSEKMQYVNVPSTTVENSSGHYHSLLRWTF